jgi:hypothetical protein
MLYAPLSGYFALVLEKVKRQMRGWGSERIKAGGRSFREMHTGLKWNEVLRYGE